MNPVLDTVRHRWAVVLVLLLLGVLGAAVVLASVSEPSSAPPADEAASTSPPGGGSGQASGGSDLPGSEPSSGPTGTPEPGSLDVVQVGERRTSPPVPLDSPAAFDSGLVLRIAEERAVTGVARGPGEIAGPAVQLTLTLRNDGEEAVSLESMVLDVSYGARQVPAVTLSGPGERLFGGTLEPGESATGRYVFAIPVQGRDRVRVVASHAGDVAAVALAGSVR